MLQVEPGERELHHPLALLGAGRERPVHHPQPVLPAAIAERKAQAVKPTTAIPVAKKTPQPPKPALTKGTVNKRETTQAGGEAGEAQFQRAAAFLRQGRVSEAEEQLRAGVIEQVGMYSTRLRTARKSSSRGYIAAKVSGRTRESLAR